MAKSTYEYTISQETNGSSNQSVWGHQLDIPFHNQKNLTIVRLIIKI